MCLCENIFKHFANLKLKSHRFAWRTVVYKLTDQIRNAVFHNASYWLSCVKVIRKNLAIIQSISNSVRRFFTLLRQITVSFTSFKPINNKTLQNNYKIILFLFNKDELLPIALKIKFHVFYKFCWPGMHKTNSNKCPKCSEFCEFLVSDSQIFNLQCISKSSPFLSDFYPILLNFDRHVAQEIRNKRIIYYYRLFTSCKTKCGKLHICVWFKFPRDMFLPKISKIGRNGTKIKRWTFWDTVYSIFSIFKLLGVLFWCFMFALCDCTARWRFQ